MGDFFDDFLSCDTDDSTQKSNVESNLAEVAQDNKPTEISMFGEENLAKVSNDGDKKSQVEYEQDEEEDDELERSQKPSRKMLAIGSVLAGVALILMMFVAFEKSLTGIFSDEYSIESYLLILVGSLGCVFTVGASIVFAVAFKNKIVKIYFAISMLAHVGTFVADMVMQDYFIASILLMAYFVVDIIFLCICLCSNKVVEFKSPISVIMLVFGLLLTALHIVLVALKVSEIEMDSSVVAIAIEGIALAAKAILYGVGFYLGIDYLIMNKGSAQEEDDLSNVEDDTTSGKDDLSNVEDDTTSGKDDLSNVVGDTISGKDDLSNVVGDTTSEEDDLSNVVGDTISVEKDATLLKENVGNIESNAKESIANDNKTESSAEDDFWN